ncbi:hypothetical protein OJAV_G00133290 [Oryzias javanicus]|uniref:Uncharacterized protein n=1 Tax=Oryzias javanicus TaxID=123683 RepID=A0A3S2M0C5_ORYJA|nr:hypothetical protein OJAV_G00133290 [Oryzias javanicus]
MKNDAEKAGRGNMTKNWSVPPPNSCLQLLSSSCWQEHVESASVSKLGDPYIWWTGSDPGICYLFLSPKQTV